MRQVREKAERTLVFVYNADSGIWNALSDLVHKTVSPSTYPCDLCAMTYGLGGVRRRWSRFIRELDYEVEFTYRDLVGAKHPRLSTVPLPCVYLVEGEQVSELVSAQEFGGMQTLEELIGKLSRKLELF